MRNSKQFLYNTMFLMFLFIGLLGLVTGCKKEIKVFDIDGNTYDTVKIGTQVWMAENLKTTRYQNGDHIPNVTDNKAWANLTSDAYCDYDNNSDNVKTYGRMYNGYAVTDPRKLAPKGWHIATDSEWTILTNYLGGEEAAGAKLKEKGLAHWIISNTAATNETGFNALPGGERATDGTFLLIGRDGFWWSPAENLSYFIQYRRMNYNESSVERDNHPKRNGFSVRCLRD
jgi:uncharacterized protein (TIGR02145 family)